MPARGGPAWRRWWCWYGVAVLLCALLGDAGSRWAKERELREQPAALQLTSSSRRPSSALGAACGGQKVLASDAEARRLQLCRILWSKADPLLLELLLALAAGLPLRVVPLNFEPLERTHWLGETHLSRRQRARAGPAIAAADPLCSSPSSLSLLTTAKEGHASLLVEPAALTFDLRALTDNRRARPRHLALPPPRHGRRGVRRRGRAPEGRRPHRRARATADPPGRPRPPRRHLYPPRAPSLPRLGRPPPSSRPGSRSPATLTRLHAHRATSALSKSATGPVSRTTTSGSSSSPPGSPSSRPCSSPSASPRPGSRPRTPSSAVQHSGRAT